MNEVVKVKDLIIGEGRPKLCVPIVAFSNDKILETAIKIAASSMEMVEWRADFYEGVTNQSNLLNMLKELRKILGNIPLLFTFRTVEEGGNRKITMEEYTQINLWAISSGCIDMVDAEVFRGNDVVEPVMNQAKKHGVTVIGSNHDFKKTPCREELIQRFQIMQKAGADITKIAVMPVCQEDVLTLMEVTLAMKNTYADRPFITMSMGAKGLVSRITGEVFGSSVTFGAVGQASAPGQIPAEELEQVLNVIHRYSK